MDEAEQLCDRLVIMDQGRIVAEGSPRELIDRYSTRDVVELRFDLDEPPHDALRRLEAHSDRVEVLNDRVLVFTGDGDAIAGTLDGNGVKPTSVLVRRSTLEDVFLTLTGRTLDD
jgi:lipooligosaccharide transport system ATP-binding protein